MVNIPKMDADVPEIKSGVMSASHRELLSETRMRFNLMVSSMSVAAVTKLFLGIPPKLKIYHNLAHDSLYILTRNNVTIYFQSAANHTNVSCSSRDFSNLSVDFKKSFFYSFGKGDSRASSFVV